MDDRTQRLWSATEETFEVVVEIQGKIQEVYANIQTSTDDLKTWVLWRRLNELQFQSYAALLRFMEAQTEFSVHIRKLNR